MSKKLHISYDRIYTDIEIKKIEKLVIKSLDTFPNIKSDRINTKIVNSKIIYKDITFY